MVNNPYKPKKTKKKFKIDTKNMGVNIDKNELDFIGKKHLQKMHISEA